MARITTVRAALETVATYGWTAYTRYQLGSAMGPAQLYVPIATSESTPGPHPADGSGNPRWLRVFTQPDPQWIPRKRGAGARVRYQELTGAAILRLAADNGSGIVVDAGSRLECRVSERDALSMQVAAGHTEALVRRPQGLENRGGSAA